MRHNKFFVNQYVENIYYLYWLDLNNVFYQEKNDTTETCSSSLIVESSNITFDQKIHKHISQSCSTFLREYTYRELFKEAQKWRDQYENHTIAIIHIICSIEHILLSITDLKLLEFTKASQLLLRFRKLLIVRANYFANYMSKFYQLLDSSNLSNISTKVQFVEMSNNDIIESELFDSSNIVLIYINEQSNRDRHVYCLATLVMLLFNTLGDIINSTKMIIDIASIYKSQKYMSLPNSDMCKYINVQNIRIIEVIKNISKYK